MMQTIEQDRSAIATPPREEELPSGVRSQPPVDLRALLVQQLSQIADPGTLAGACEAGRLISQYRFEADRGEKPKPGVVRASSFRQLARMQGMPMSPASLCRAVSIHHLTLRMPELLTFRRVGIGHVSTVLRLPEDVQINLLYRAEQLGWSRSHLQAEVDAFRYTQEQAAQHPFLPEGYSDQLAMGYPAHALGN